MHRLRLRHLWGHQGQETICNEGVGPGSKACLQILMHSPLPKSGRLQPGPESWGDGLENASVSGALWPDATERPTRCGFPWAL